MALSRFTPDQRRCYVDSEFRFKYLPQELYRLVQCPNIIILPRLETLVPGDYRADGVDGPQEMEIN